MKTPAPFASLKKETRASVTRVYFDVDDTLTLHGRLPARAVASLERAHHAGISLVAVTGRSAAWGELLLRLFPLDAAVAETGAICFYPRKSGGIGALHAEPDVDVREAHTQRRLDVARDILKRVPDARLALDNMGRLYDVAFDLKEDGPPISPDVAAHIREILVDAGLTVAQSSVHINAWFGDFDKSKMVERYLSEVEGVRLDDVKDTLVYVGDSTNDGAMFARTPLSVGVKNIAPHLETLHARNQAPAFVVDKDGGDGFVDVIDGLLDARA